MAAEAHGPPQKCGVLIVGGGPAGLGAAIMLAERGWTDISVCESRPSLVKMKSDLSYVYLVDGRGRKFMDRYGLTPQLDEYGASSRANIPITRVFPSGKITRSMAVPSRDPSRISHFIPRGKLMQILVDGVISHPVASKEVKLLTNTRIVSIHREEGHGGYVVKAVAETNSGQDTETITLCPRLLMGCDGIHSMVRETSRRWVQEELPQDSGRHGSKNRNLTSERFSLVQLPSLATGLRYKVIVLPPNPATKAGVVLHNSEQVILPGAPFHVPGTRRKATPMRLGMHPIRDPAAPRTANLITLPDHPIWEVSDKEGMATVLREGFPQIDLPGLMGDEQLESFAASRGGQFPSPQYSTGMTFTMKAAGGPLEEAPAGPEGASGIRTSAGAGAGGQGKGTLGVVLIGDSLHCFPPDIAQGVNSALEDVLELDKALEDCEDDLGRALPVLEERRMPDVVALVKLAQVLYPVQYRQYPLLTHWWNFKTMIHLALHKASFGLLLPQPAFFTLLLNSKVEKYREVWRQHVIAQARLKTMGVLAVLLLVLVAVRKLLQWTVGLA